MQNTRQRAIDGLSKGDRFTVVRTFSVEEIQRFADISRDYNPVHVDLPYAQLRSFRAPISHGLLTASLLTEIGGQIGWLATGMSFQFKRPVYAGEQITCVWEITYIDERGRARASIQITNPDGEVVLQAETTGVLPGENERARLREMVADGDPTNGACP